MNEIISNIIFFSLIFILNLMTPKFLLPLCAIAIIVLMNSKNYKEKFFYLTLPFSYNQLNKKDEKLRKKIEKSFYLTSILHWSIFLLILVFIPKSSDLIPHINFFILIFILMVKISLDFIDSRLILHSNCYAELNKSRSMLMFLIFLILASVIFLVFICFMFYNFK